MNSKSVSPDFIDYDYTCQPFHLESDNSDTCSVQDSIFEDLMNVSGSTFGRPSEFQ